MPAKRDFAEARSYVRKKLGKAFEAKCGDALALLLHEQARRPTEAAVHLPILLTFTPIDLTKEILAAVEDIRSRLAAVVGKFPSLKAVGTFREALHALTVADQVGAVVRSHLVGRLQEAARRRYQAIVAHLQPYGPTEAVEAGRAAGKKVLKSLMECWLTGSVRVEAPPKLLAEVAEHRALVSIDRPRRVLPEIYETATQVGAPQLRQAKGVDGTGAVVAVIDGEVDVTHPGLEGQVVQKVNFSPQPWGNPDPHGTAVAGIIASNGKGSKPPKEVVGIAPGSTIYSYKLFPMGDEFLGSVAIQQAYADGAQVINCSWYVPDPTPRDGTWSGFCRKRRSSRDSVTTIRGWAS